MKRCEHELYSRIGIQELTYLSWNKTLNGKGQQNGNGE